jgi:hypothetical protein
MTSQTDPLESRIVTNSDTNYEQGQARGRWEKLKVLRKDKNDANEREARREEEMKRISERQPDKM